MDSLQADAVAPAARKVPDVEVETPTAPPQRERETARFAPLVAAPALTPPTGRVTPPPVNVSIGRIEVSLAPPPQERALARVERIRGFAGYEGARRGRR
ncbi:hypothetical protein [Hansschlegelia zhihuaiae]|uniref:hypothetical protein n=1 Tax=Hansschlegelia zhihuaiae TaxID=405005 RepID=UPI0013E8AAD6|nr:hypothetical protein [Hansschlegelia zhihuaiae]